MNTELDIDACKQGDRAALEKLYKTYSNKLMRICLYYIHTLYLQPIITQYFIDNKSEIWLLFLIAHSKR